MADVGTGVLECALAAGADVFGGQHDVSPRRRLAGMAELIPRCVPECCGATATLLTEDERVEVASHPDLATLAEIELTTGEGTIPQAVSSGESARVGDVLAQGDWPHYRAAALAAGVRSSATLPFRRPGMLLTLTGYSFRPDGLTGNVQRPVRLLGELLASVVAADQRRERALVAVAQMDAALRSRPLVDQACGILMHAIGCDAAAAFETLRRISQQRNTKLVDVAGAVVRTRGRGLTARVGA